MMKTEKELNKDILEITVKIQNDFPELSKYIDEMPVAMPDAVNPAIGLKNLENYYNSLHSLLKTYNTSHISEANT